MGVAEIDRRLEKLIHAHLRRLAYPPSVREMAEGLGGVSTATVYRSLVRMRKMGKLTWKTGEARTLQLRGFGHVGHEGPGRS